MDENNKDTSLNAGGSGVGTNAGAMPIAPVAPTTVPKVVADISAKLGGAEASQNKSSELNAPQAEQTMPFDLSKLQPEQLQQLKAMLNATPDRVMQKRGNPIVTIRRYTGKFVIDMGNAINTLVEDKLTRMNSEVLIIPVKFLGTDTFVNVDYKELTNSEKVKCEVVSTRRINGRIVEGEIVSKETGRLVERAITTVQDFFTLKLPEGSPVETLEIEARIVNQ